MPFKAYQNIVNRHIFPKGLDELVKTVKYFATACKKISENRCVFWSITVTGGLTLTQSPHDFQLTLNTTKMLDITQMVRTVYR